MFLNFPVTQIKHRPLPLSWMWVVLLAYVPGTALVHLCQQKKLELQIVVSRLVGAGN